MKKLVTIYAVVVMILAVSSPSLATMVTLVPDTLDVTPGSTVDVSVYMTDSPGITMMAISAVILYDPAVFTYVDPSVVKCAFLTPEWDIWAGNPSGQLRVGGMIWDSPFSAQVPAGDGTVFTFTLQANAGASLGASSLSWGFPYVGEGEPVGFMYGDAEGTDVLLPSSGASINVVVPEPATMLLLGLGAVLLRKKK